MAAWRYAAWVEARSGTCWPMKSMNLPSSAAVVTLALQGKTSLSSSCLLREQPCTLPDV
jgi:hypothetical protein